MRITLLVPKILLSIFVAVLCIYGIELGLLLMTSLSSGSSGEEQANGSFDRRTKLEVALDFRSQGRDAVTSITPHMVITNPAKSPTLQLGTDSQRNDLLPLAGIANKLTVLCNETGQYMTYQSDEAGFHNPAGSWSMSALTLATVGDSHTHGYCVPTAKTFVGQIREQYPKTLNLGIAGNGPLLTLASILEFLPEFKPPIVLWFFSETNDLLDTLWERENPMLTRYLEEDFRQNLVSKQGLIDDFLSAYLEEKIVEVRNSQSGSGKGKGSLAFLKLTRVKQIIMPRLPSGVIGDFQLFQKVLGKAKHTVQSWEGELVLVYLPAHSRYNESFMGWRSHHREIKQKVLDIASGLGILVVDVDAVFLKHDEPRSLFVGHYSQEGNDLVAAAVLDALTEKISASSR